MNEEEKRQLHTFLLISLFGAGELGMRADDLLQRARMHTWNALTLPELEVQLRELADRRLLLSYGTALGAQRWRISGIGRAALAEQGLA